MRASVTAVTDVFKPKSFDIVVALDVIEHLAKDDGFMLLRHMEQLARQKVIIFTPTGFLHQPPSEDNPYQEHLSGWTPREMRREGFSVIGVSGWKPLRKEYAAIAFGPYPVTWRVSLLSQPLVRRVPKLAFELFCVKQLA